MAGGGRPLRVVVVGAGAMGMSWLRVVDRHPETELVGLADLDERRARGAAIRLRRKDLAVAGDLAGLLPLHPDACVNVTPPAAHHDVTAAALRAGIPVLSEKPFATTIGEALDLDALAHDRGRLLMVAQSRSYQPGLLQLRGLLDRAGPLGLVTCEFRRAYRQAGFRLTMSHPLLLDMAIHAFDAVRRVTGAQPVAVYAVQFNPPGSWFTGDAAATVVVEFSDGVHFTYTGSWCAPGFETSWSGNWRFSGARGTVVWDGVAPPRAELDPESAPVPQPSGVDSAADVDDPLAQLRPVLDDFVAALRTGGTPWGASSDNLFTFAVALAAIESARTGTRVEIDKVLGPHRQAV